MFLSNWVNCWFFSREHFPGCWAKKHTKDPNPADSTKKTPRFARFISNIRIKSHIVTTWMQRLQTQSSNGRNHNWLTTVKVAWRVFAHYLQGVILLMVQKSGKLTSWGRLVVYLPLFYRVFIHPRWLFGISEPTTLWFDPSQVVIACLVPWHDWLPAWWPSNHHDSRLGCWYPGISQKSFLVPLIGGRYHVITQLAIYKWNQKQPLNQSRGCFFAQSCLGASWWHQSRGGAEF